MLVVMLAISRLHGFPGEQTGRAGRLAGRQRPARRRRIFRVRQGRHSARMGRARATAGGRAGHGERRRDRGRGRPPLKARQGIAGTGRPGQIGGRDRQRAVGELSHQQRAAVRLGPGHAQPAGLDVIKRLAAILNKNEYQVSVEGHSDTVPIQTRQFASNWELSSSRATSVLRELVRDGVSAGRLRAVGYAETRPIESNETPVGRARQPPRRADHGHPRSRPRPRRPAPAKSERRRAAAPLAPPSAANGAKLAACPAPGTSSMSYLLLIVEPVGQRAERTPEQGRGPMAPCCAMPKA